MGDDRFTLKGDDGLTAFEREMIALKRRQVEALEAQVKALDAEPAAKPSFYERFRAAFAWQ